MGEWLRGLKVVVGSLMATLSVQHSSDLQSFSWQHRAIGRMAHTGRKPLFQHFLCNWDIRIRQRNE
jgi:hypothetical protein